MAGSRRFSCISLILLSFCSACHSELDKNVMRQTLPAYTLASHSDLLNSTCRKELEIFRDAVDRRILWALKVLDSSGEPKPGFVYGNNYWLGVRSQCKDSTNRMPLVLTERELLNNSKYRDQEEEFPPFDVNYFVAHFQHNSTLQYHVRLPNEDLITLGLCLPASCTTDDLSIILTKIFRERELLIGELYSADFSLLEVRDLIDDSQWLLNGRIIFISIILCATWALMIAGTIYDVCVHQRYLKAKKSITFENNNAEKENEEATESVLTPLPDENRVGKVLMCFSIYTNTRMIFDTQINGDSIHAIHGLRFLGMVWIIMIHTVFFMSDYADNKPWSWRMAEGFAVQVISNSTLSVDTYFFLSGFLVSYLYFKDKNKNKEEPKAMSYRAKFNVYFMSVLKRFIRLTPAYMMAVGLVELNFTWYGKVSQFYMTERPQEVCPKYWWRNLLYINNLFDRETMCMSWSWYLSNDMQFFVICTFLLTLSSIHFNLAAGILFSLLFGSIAVTGYVSYVSGYTPTMDQQYHFLEILYDPPWTRIGPYIIGIITAYILYRLNNKLHLRTRTVAICWCLGSSCNLIVLFGLWERHISVLSTAFYVALSRTVWAVGLAWLLIACCTNHGGIVNQILSFKGWVPLSRLTYCAYILNPFLMNSVSLHSESTLHVDFLPNGIAFLGYFVVTYFCAYAYSLMMETPYVLLMRQFMNSRSRRK